MIKEEKGFKKKLEKYGEERDKEVSDIEYIKRMRDSPLFFIKEMWGLTPHIKGTTFKSGKQITWQQVEILQAIEDAISGKGSKKVSIKSGRGIGKSALLSMLVIWYLFCNYNARIACTAPSQSQMHDVLWSEIALWLNMLPVNVKEKFEWTRDYIRISESPQTWYARARTSRKENPEALSGLHSANMMLLCDEASGIPDVIFEYAKGALTSANALFIMISNPTRNMGYFFNSFNKFSDGFQNLSFNSEESPIVDNAFVNEIITEYGVDSDEYRTNVLGEFPREDSIDDKGYVPLVQYNDIKFTIDNEFDYYRVIGIDPSGEGKDETVWVLRDAFKSKILHSEKISSGKSIASKTIQLMGQYNVPDYRVVIDNFGVGVDCIKELALRSYNTVSLFLGKEAINKKRFLNKRAEMFWMMREWLKKGGELTHDKRWNELFVLKYKRTEGNQIKIMGKDEMRREGIKSPNFADALMLTFGISVEREYKTVVGNYGHRL